MAKKGIVIILGEEKMQNSIPDPKSSNSIPDPKSSLFYHLAPKAPPFVVLLLVSLHSQEALGKVHLFLLPILQQLSIRQLVARLQDIDL